MTAQRKRRGRPFIVKVQLSLHTSEKRRQMLVYDRRRRREFQGDATVDVTRAMKRRPKAFFWATLNDRSEFELHEEAPWQEW